MSCFSKWIFFPLIVFAAAAGCRKRSFGPSESGSDSLLDPHRLPKQGPWFEGWYIRITPAAGTQRSLGLIVGSYLPKGVLRTEAEAGGLTGYAALLDGGSEGKPLRAFEAFPPRTRLYLNRSDIVHRDPAPLGKPSFRWAAEGIGELTGDSAQISFPNGASLKLVMSEVLPWNTGGLGPEGIVSLFRSFPLHWFVHSLRSRVEFEATVPSEQSGAPEKLSGTGFAHFEKNWGVSFPPAYVWMQAFDGSRNRAVAVAGGRPLKVGPVSPEAWLAGYRSPAFSVDFAPQNAGTFFESTVDACSGKFDLTAAFMNRRLTVSARAERSTFGGIAIPKDSGFEKDGSEQSFQTKITTKLFDVVPFSPLRDTDKLLEENVFENGALEFGSAFKCTKQIF
jgi:hypothetical protein